MEKTKTLIVTYVNPHFVVTDPEISGSAGEAKIHESVFYSELYKYRSDFERTFSKCFPEKMECEITSSAQNRLNQILYLNRL